MGVFKIPDKLWQWGISLAILVFYLSSMIAIQTDKGIYGQAGAALLAGVILLYFIFDSKRLKGRKRG
ncbi:MAG TPA: hypothetical protein VI546_02665 [candidate division Zixibacteria bacterium]|nr:hypothetical protein [candidate division Zixibacteria bacterium]